jgi:putative DNA modification/repair radical SAM protein
MNQEALRKLEILAGAAKYDVSCASSGTQRNNSAKGIGTASAWGICHSFADDGRCISLLKVMLTNYCIYDCAYCVNRRSNDVRRTAFTPDEIIDLTIEFYRRNYIEGLFLSSGIMKNPDYTMERMVKVVKDLRLVHRYNGYIHMKSIPGSSGALVREAGTYADRLSVNMEISTEQNLKFLAPDKNYPSILKPMEYIHQGILEYKEERQKTHKVPRFAPAGQSTQLIIGATPESDNQILHLASSLYSQNKLKRVYYSGFIPVNSYDKRLPALSAPPMVREHRLYQADWLYRFYRFKIDEIVNETNPNLDLEIDPKLSYALRHPELFPIDVNKADYEMILRIPGVGPKSAQMIIMARRYGRITSDKLKKMGVVMKRAQYFITCGELNASNLVSEARPEYLKKLFTEQVKSKRKPADAMQLNLW